MHCLFFILMSITFASSHRSPLIDRKIDCYARRRIYHEESDDCYPLLEKGPCQPGEWLVLKKADEWDANPNPVCAAMRCSEEEFDWAEAEQCVHVQDKHILCNGSLHEEPVINLFGVAECICQEDVPRARLYGDRRSPCYELYKQGPCPHGHVLVLQEGGESGAFCAVDPCRTQTVIGRESGTLSEYAILAPFEDGKCYELETQGPCKSNELFRVDRYLWRGKCWPSQDIIASAIIPARNCNVDINGDCQREVAKKLDVSHINEFERLLQKVQ